jgi:hypothetical protein
VREVGAVVTCETLAGVVRAIHDASDRGMGREGSR